MPGLASPALSFREVFVSGTKVDLDPYRLVIKQALEEDGIGVFLFDYDAQPAIDVVEYCVRRVRDISDAYLGIYGYRYGWIPAGRPEEKSITHVEYETACERWVPSERHRLFLFQPEPGSSAAAEVEQMAEDALARDFPDNGSCPDWQARRQASRDKQSTFLNTIAAPCVVINRFNTRDDLKRRAPLAVRNGEGWIDQRAAPTRGRPPVVASYTGFGAIGRTDQLETLNRAWSAVNSRGDSPAIAVVVHGDRTMGHRWFADSLQRWGGWEGPRDHLRLIPPEVRTEPAWLRNTMIAGLAPGSAAPVADFQMLAAAIQNRCTNGPTVVILDHIERMRGVLAAFQGEFWVPLHNALRELWTVRPPRHRFALVVILRTPLANPLPPFVWPDAVTDPLLDYDRLVPLPTLGKLKKADLKRYVRDVLNNWTINDADIARLTGRGVPEDVFGRLVADDLIDLAERN